MLNTTRRSALAALIAAITALPLRAAPGQDPDREAARLPGRIRRLFGSRHSAALPTTFRTCRGLSDEELACAVVTGGAHAADGVHGLSDEQLRRRIRSNIESDYRDARTVRIGPWCVARTEAYAIELLQRAVGVS